MNPATTVLQSLSTTELFEVLPITEARTALLASPDQIDRWEPLNGDHRDAHAIVTGLARRGGTTYWVSDILHALVLRQAARQAAQTADILWDLGLQQYAVMVTSPCLGACID